ncbi:transcription repressor OFP13 [Brachypodium distachyon]|uniref:Transcription repressor n=1 Tax=Brachypodium distachyon TaxID=15368 RepID=I1HTN7_BRADI|nr:transcription repressor OFP13 [Brachypodium distachyon]PNT73240.1 hypothetical protein BRADI_2g55827v3 [Brachypodium distachyon]|eukprot:XP_010233558.1 transcription repressor OFP13 [Brachypodium distachyon]
MVTRKLALGSLFHTKAAKVDIASSSSPPRDPAAAAPAWAWPSCKHPRTQSFHHAALPPPGAPRTLASIFLDSAESSFTSSSARQHEDDCSADDSLSSTASEASAAGEADDSAIVVGGLRIRSSDRLLFDPAAGASATSSILEEKPLAARARARDHEVFVGGLAVAFESANPYRDFRASMEEMLDAAHGVGAGFLGCGWGWLEEMLGWYLRANGEDTHGAIVAAFIDVIVAIADRQARCACSSRSCSCTSVDRELGEEPR